MVKSAKEGEYVEADIILLYSARGTHSGVLEVTGNTQYTQERWHYQQWRAHY